MSRLIRGLIAVGRILDFILKEARNHWRILSRGATQFFHLTFLVLQKNLLAVGYRKCSGDAVYLSNKGLIFRLLNI